MKPLITLTALCVMTTALPARAVDVVFDYTYDSTGFFTAEKRAVLDQVSQVFSLNLLDTLTAITPSGRNAFTVDFFDPQNPFGASKVVKTSRSQPTRSGYSSGHRLFRRRHSVSAGRAPIR
jgi:hypothetical protein